MSRAAVDPVRAELGNELAAIEAELLRVRESGLFERVLRVSIAMMELGWSNRFGAIATHGRWMRSYDLARLLGLVQESRPLFPQPKAPRKRRSRAHCPANVIPFDRARRDIRGES